MDMNVRDDLRARRAAMFPNLAELAPIELDDATPEASRIDVVVEKKFLYAATARAGSADQKSARLPHPPGAAVEFSSAGGPE
ncbi:hypothetical protein COL154_014206 [Colletotrichum chrysophilum]|nr:hypothetical protein COL154_014206 [Colletotrichum chrysophilum]